MIVGYSPTPGWQVSVVSCEYYYYSCIHITDFSCCSLLGFHYLIFTEQKYGTIISSHYFEYQVQALKRRLIRGSILLL